MHAHFYFQVFKHNLLTIVQDHHEAFLRQNGFPISIAAVAAWHPDFDCDSLPDVDMVDFPTKPYVEKVTTAQGMIQVIRFYNFPGRKNVPLIPEQWWWFDT